MLSVLWVPLIVQLIVPVSLLLWFAFGHHGSRAIRLLAAALVACYLVAITLAGLWLVLPWYLPAVYGVLFLLALLRSFGVRSRTMWPYGVRGVAGTVVLGGLVLFVGGIAVYAAMGRRAPNDAVELSFPLQGGTYLVANGGGNELINAHLQTLTAERFRSYRGQSYGVDLVQIDALGWRARSIAPRDPEAYVIFGNPVFAPCTGTVIEAADSFADLHPPQTDRRHPAGNHVLLGCGHTWVLLGHLQQGSVRVRAGERVGVAQPLGRVGNTGNTDEPHLHIHAQRPGTRDAPLGGEPLPIRFGDRYPVRNARIARSQ